MRWHLSPLIDSTTSPIRTPAARALLFLCSWVKINRMSGEWTLHVEEDGGRIEEEEEEDEEEEKDEEEEEEWEEGKEE